MKATAGILGTPRAGHAGDLGALCEALLELKNPEECRLFLLDLCTPAEIAALTERWKIARLLDAGELSYREIHDRTGGSLATITRVARFLKQEPYQGYRLILQRLSPAKRKAKSRA